MSTRHTIACIPGDGIGTEVIAVGRRSTVAAVEAAARTIRSLLDHEAATHRRAALAYLDKELAAAHRNEGNALRVVLHAARSLARVPRTRASLDDWWRFELITESP